jgi:putative membrane protein
MMGGGMMGWMVLGWLLVVLVLAAAIAGIVLVIVRASRNSPPPGSTPERPANAALEILKRRYAQGEIDAEQYERMKRQLEQR